MPSLHLCILDAKYEHVDMDDVADNQKHLTPTQREELRLCSASIVNSLMGRSVCSLTRSVISNLKKALNRYLRGSTQCRYSS